MKRGKYQPRIPRETVRGVVRDIRQWHAKYSAMPKPRDICDRHNISRNGLYDILAGRAYRHVR